MSATTQAPRTRCVGADDGEPAVHAEQARVGVAIDARRPLARVVTTNSAASAGREARRRVERPHGWLPCHARRQHAIDRAPANSAARQSAADQPAYSAADCTPGPSASRRAHLTRELPMSTSSDHGVAGRRLTSPEWKRCDAAVDPDEQRAVGIGAACLALDAVGTLRDPHARARQRIERRPARRERPEAAARRNHRARRAWLPPAWPRGRCDRAAFPAIASSRSATGSAPSLSSCARDAAGSSRLRPSPATTLAGPPGSVRSCSSRPPSLRPRQTMSLGHLSRTASTARGPAVPRRPRRRGRVRAPASPAGVSANVQATENVSPDPNGASHERPRRPRPARWISAKATRG